MISPYTRPQDTITQILQKTPSRAASRTNPIVIGPQYKLFLNDGRDLTAAKFDFAVAGATHDYVDTDGDAISLTALTPDTDNAVLYGQDLEALVASFGSEAWAVDTDYTNWRAIRVAANTISGSGTLNTTLDGRAVAIGDVFSMDWDDGDAETGTTRRRVVGLLGVVTPSSIPTNASALGAYNPQTLGADTATLVAAETDGVWSAPDCAVTADKDVFQAHGNLVTVSGVRYLGDTISIVCTTGGASGTAKFTVTSAANGITATEVASVDPGAGEFEIDLTDVGYPGSTLELVNSGDAVAAQKAKVIIRPAYTLNPVTKIATGGTYTGAIDRRYAVEILAVTDSGTEVDIKVYDVAGNDAPVTYTDAIATGAVDAGTSGFTVTVAGSTAYAKGEIFYVDATAAVTSGTQFDGVLLDGPAVPAATMEAYPATTLEAVYVHQRYTGTLTSSNLSGGIGDALTAGAADWEYAADLGLNKEDTGRDTVALSPFADGYGKVFLSYKAVVLPAATEGMIELDSETAIIDALGETGYENWLAAGALSSFQGNQNEVVYALRTSGDTVAAFTTALKKIQTTDQVYTLTPMTDVQDVMELVASHCDTMSNKYKKNFRRCYVGTDSPGAYTHWGALPDTTYRRGDLASSVFTLAEAYRDDWTFVSADVGASLTVQSIGLTFTITEILSDYEVLTDADTGLSATNSGVEVVRPDTPENTALFVIARSQALDSRRCVNVWCDNPTTTVNDVTTVVPMKFVAAEIAGLRCALLPQQGLTMTEILSVDAAPSMYTIFDDDLLDSIAQNGTMVVTQESEGGDMFIRHQLTTKTTDGALAWEDSVGVIVDDFCYQVKDEFREYVGRRNATPDTISEIDDKLKALASSATTAPLADQDIGPAVLTFFDEKGNEGQVTVRQDGDLADTLMTYVKLRVPLPLNGLNHYVDVDVSEVLASADN